jgi:hypothetical protein
MKEPRLPDDTNPYEPPQASLTIAEPPISGPSMIVLLQVFLGMFLFSAISTYIVIRLLEADLNWLSVEWLVLAICFLLGMGLGWHRSIIPSSVGLVGLFSGMAVASIWTLGLEATWQFSVFYFVVLLFYCSGAETASLIRKSLQPKTVVKYEYKQHLR